LTLYCNKNELLYPKSSLDKEDAVTEKSIGDQDPVKGWFIPTWVVLVLAGLAIEFFGRFFGYENNPTGIWHVSIPQLAASLSVVTAIAGYFTFNGGKQKRSSLRMRNGALLMATGFLMLATSFLFKMVMPVIFG
jgi:hypothetical protein